MSFSTQPGRPLPALIPLCPRRKIFLLSLFFLLLWTCPASPREVTLTILFTNDHHGQVEPLRTDDLSKPVGGVARRMALIEKIRKEVGPDRVVLVDSGDLFSGTAFSELSQGQVDCEAYQLMKYDAVGLGEHDFDYGRKTLLEYRKNFRIPWVAANVNSSGQPFLRPYVLKATGVRVGLIGFSNPDTPALIGRETVRGLVFNPPGAVAKGLHSIFKKDADLFVVLSRLGVEGDKKFAKDNPFIHVVIGGHSQTVLTEPIVTKLKDGKKLGPIICQAGSQGLYLGRLDLTVEGHRDPKTKKAEYSVEDYHYRLIPITSDLPEDGQMVELLQKYKDRLKEKPLDEVLANFSEDLTRSSDGDSLIGQLAVDGMRKSAQTEVALLNNGFFKSGFKTGDLTREVLYEIVPTDSEITAIDVPGISLRKALEASAAIKGQDDFLQVSGLTVEKTGEGLKIKVGEEPLSDTRKYQVAVNDFLAGGGAGYDFFRKLKSRRKAHTMIRELLEETFKTKAKITAADLEKRWNLL
jgi:5'-nucleotidase/UDP-sugar diphosphatase